MKNKNYKILFFIASILSSSAMSAQYYRVYGWETLRRGWMEVMVWNKTIAESDLSFERNGNEYSRQGLFLHSAEIEYGITDKFTVGMYGDFRDSPDVSLSYYRFRAVARYSLFSKYKRFFNSALYLEYYQPSKEVEEASELEMRFILQKDLGDFRINLNPAISKDISGEEVKDGLNGNFFGGIYWRRHYTIQLGAEYYGRHGELRDLAPSEEQEHVVFAVADLKFFKGFNWQLGAGTGLNAGSDDLILKSIITYEFNTLRPFRQSR
ncbi:hypothetical protein [Zunongwangia sp. H14]|uniref:hypothetical protein n=1 Tax=Zunongwangia sp. H14 TaxID=3240792 RepID=UPI0035660EB6